MTNQFQKKQTKPSFSTYQITVKGAFTENWRDWFNGMLVGFERGNEDNPRTLITCQVRDQAELLGILNWLHSMNVKLLQLNFIQ